MQSKVSGHWTDEQLIAHLYGVGPEEDHLGGCEACGARLSQLQRSREALERASPAGAEISSDFLAAQRRHIYARLSQPARWWSGARLRRWASASATLLVLAGGVMVYQEHHEQELVKEQVSDAQLAAEVSSMAQESEPSSTAPLQALFE